MMKKRKKSTGRNSLLKPILTLIYSFSSRVKSVPKFKVQKNKSVLKTREQEKSNYNSTIDLKDSYDQLDSLINEYSTNQSLLHDKSQVYHRTKGSYHFDKMMGRTKHGIMEFQPSAHEKRFEKQKSLKKR